MTVSAQDLINQARYRTGTFGSTFIDDTNDCLAWADQGYKELYDLLVDAYGAPYFMTSTDFRASASSRTTALATSYNNCAGVGQDSGIEILKLIRVEVERSNIRAPLLPFNLTDRVMNDDTAAWDDNTEVRYFFAQNTFYWEPIPSTNQCVTIYYVPAPGELTSLTVTIARTAEPWREFIVLHIAEAIAAKQRDTEAVQVYSAQKAAVRARVISSAPPREIGQPQRVVDVRSHRGDYDDWYTWEGW